jgi:plastocyanin
MRRRTYLRTAGSVAAMAATTAAIPGSTAGIEDGAAPESVVTADGDTTVAVGPDGDFVFTPGTDELLAITPGTAVEFVWESDTHNIVVESQPDGANWEGHEGIENAEFTHEHIFDTQGTYQYYCAPHHGAGMEATLVVTDDPAAVTPAGNETATPGGTATDTPGGDGTETPGDGDGSAHTVEMTDGLAFEPDSLTVAPGDTVTWDNVGGQGHSVTAYEEGIPDGAEYWASGGFDSEQAARDGYGIGGSLEETGNVPGGESWSHTFETEGTHEYFCIPHEGGGMVGQIEVSADGGDGGSSLPIGVPGLIFGGLGAVVVAVIGGVYYRGKREGRDQNTAAIAGIGVIVLGLLLVVAIVARLLVGG